MIHLHEIALLTRRNIKNTSLCGGLEDGALLLQKRAVARIQPQHERRVFARILDGETVVRRKIEIPSPHAVEEEPSIKRCAFHPEQTFETSRATMIGPSPGLQNADLDSIRRLLSLPGSGEDRDAVTASGRAFRHSEHIALQASERKVFEDRKSKVHRITHSRPHNIGPPGGKSTPHPENLSFSFFSGPPPWKD